MYVVREQLGSHGGGALDAAPPVPPGAGLSDEDILALFMACLSDGPASGSVAGDLVSRFGDLARIIAAPRAQLSAIDGLGPVAVQALKLAEAIAHRAARIRVLQRPVISGGDALMTYCRTTMGLREIEQVRALYLNSQNILIADEVVSEGTVDHAPVYPREIVRRALELHAKALILVHNHPSGDPSPSQEDITMTRRLQDACGTLDLVLHDHIIVGHGREVSLRAAGWL